MLTVQLVKKISANKGLVLAVSDCLLNQAKYELIKEKVDAYTLPIFEELSPSFPLNEIAAAMGIDKIKGPGEIYLADLESDEVKGYWAALESAHVENGFDVPDGCCPALMAQSKWLESKIALANMARMVSGGSLPDADAVSIACKLDEYVDILIKVVMAGPHGQSITNVAQAM